MMDPKAALQQGPDTMIDTSTLGTQFSAISISEDSLNSTSPEQNTYNVFILAGFGNRYILHFINVNE
jgi:hypothetical protein